MDRSTAPVLDALTAYQAQERLPFAPPGHKQGREAAPVAADRGLAEPERGGPVPGETRQGRTCSYPHGGFG